ncbi:HDIG domain-containing protein [Geobacter sulfurreducens]|uniref:Membrane-associated metal-dependent phosphohydrolase, HDc domain-containing n=1 Tax=Geobacter sulfurreducens (strain ATCC 51573 / DSM 12127 / PCA) TaxID=243231 RepID=Q74AR7_GEOSL|nr:HDIG domain-containing metalloprotein [Geobacter sulfurreducens]AAR35661.1 membrane-associated metal-dependent phosphohydrolase, HDc domain-containing [Geobacter sulfurreducens PCA]ADI85045.2 membrane-associated metal-dependent phosphohydrolase, HDc domain-containing [Geobacter sulfurreducens KN400]UAC02997.1 HDIG domain-containing protein [Geobacter sulfurreducens]HCD95046.1 HD family phosphohydrolase [Geobacter sulfurreducens]
MPSQSGNNDRDIRGSLSLSLGRLVDNLFERFSSPRHENRNRRILLVATAIILTFVIFPRQEFMSVRHEAGDIASTDIRATRDHLLEDRALTERKRKEAENAVPFVYSFDQQAAAELVKRFEQALVVLREAATHQQDAEQASVDEALSDIFGFAPSRAEIAALMRLGSSSELIEQVSQLADHLYSHKIIADKGRFAADSAHGITLVDSRSGEPLGKMEYAVAPLSVEEAGAALKEVRIAAGGVSQRETESLKGLVAKAVKPNLSFNDDLTIRNRMQARESVRPSYIQVKRGEMIVRVGERITEDQAQKLEMLFAARHGIHHLFTAIGIMGLVLVLFYFPYRFARKNIRKFNPTSKDLLLIALITVGLFFVFKIGMTVSAALGTPFPSIDTHDYFYLFPFAVGPMIIRIILNSEVAMVYAAITAPLLGIMFNNSLFVVVYALLGGIVGAHGVRHCKDRSRIYTAGLKVSVVNLAMAFSFQVMGDSFLTTQTLWSAAFALAGGIVCSAIVTGVIPLIETVFHYVTDIKLLELSNLNSPILRELMVRAPGTYHHSVLVGNLVEAAAEAINANPLLARVAAYYHDIGKISKPQYFIENVGGGENRHDKLSPNMSALILISHVKEGVELAREHRLGRPIIDIIRQSHGTALISFFYGKAKNVATEGQTVNERDFRYPGPKPQTREAGLVMLADCVEAASRTLADPTPARIQGLVQKIINNIFIDGQLDECELTLKNLHEIAKSFNQILAGIYHHRIDYPEPAYKEKDKTPGGKKTLEGSDNEQTKTPSDRDETPKKGGGDDLRRLGISR